MRLYPVLSAYNYIADEGLLIGLDGKPSRRAHIPWPAPPEDVSTSCGSAKLYRELTFTCQASSHRTFSPYFLAEVCPKRLVAIPDLRLASQRSTRVPCSRYTPLFLSKYLSHYPFRSILHLRRLLPLSTIPCAF